MSAPRAPPPPPLTLELPKLELEIRPAEWVPATKLASAFAARTTDASTYCSQCATFYDSPIAFFAHIDKCN
ncbi:hypothetical protein H4R19_000453 [Coemansia spiralis]|nr:hypothetical protein H4R19_000453 [Coemansia spiralis]